MVADTYRIDEEQNPDRRIKVKIGLVSAKEEKTDQDPHQSDAN